VDETFIAPKTFVSELSARVVGKPRDATTFNNLLHAARDMIRTYDVPSDLVPRAVVLSTHLAFVNTMDLEISSLNTLLESHSKFDVLNSMITKFNRIRVWDVNLGFRLCFIVGLFVYAKTFRLLKLRTNLCCSTFFTICALYFVRNPITITGSIFDMLNIRHLTGYNPINYVTTPVQSFTLPSISLDPMGLISRFWKNVRGLIIRDSTTFKDVIVSMPPSYIVKDTKEGKITQCLSVAGIVDPYVTPIVYAGTQANETVSVVKRGIRVSASVDIETLDHFKVEMPKIVKLILPPKIVRINYKFWNNRYPFGVRERHNKVYNEVAGCSNLENLDYRIKAFVKREKQLLMSASLDSKDPRLISGRTDGYNVTTGPFCLAMSNYMIAELNNRKRLFYAAGSTCDGVGEWFSQVGHNNPLYNYIESDGNRYDANQLPEICNARVDSYAQYTNNPFLLSVMRKDVTRKYGSTPHGVHYKVSGTMPSGSGDTSFGNSLLNLSSNIAAIAHQTGKGYPEILSSIYMAVMGDDNVLIVPSSYPKLNNKYLNGTGMSIEMVYRDNSYDLTFCSSYFYPVAGGYCLGPKIGRFLPKFGWYVDVPTPSLYSTHLATIQSIERDVSFIEPLHMVVQKQKTLLLEKHVRPRRIPKSYNFHVSKTVLASDDTAAFLDYHYGWNLTTRCALQRELDLVTSLPAFISSTAYEIFIAHDREVAKYTSIIQASCFDFVNCFKCVRFLLSSNSSVTHSCFELGLALLIRARMFPIITDVLSFSDVLLSLYRVYLCKQSSFSEFLRVFVNAAIEEIAKRYIPGMSYILPSVEFGMFVGMLIRSGNPLIEWFVLRRVIVFVKHFNWTNDNLFMGIASHFAFNSSCHYFMDGLAL
jgi:hypothetical protein